MSLKVLKVQMPAFLASALINGDSSGLEQDDLKWVDKAIAYCAPGNIVDVGESFFSWHCELPGYALGAEMAEYTVLYDEKDL